MKKKLGVVVKLSDFDEDEDGSNENKINYNKFFQLAAMKVEQKRTATDAFALFDSSGKGVVTIEDVQRVASELGESFKIAELEEMVNEVDRSGVGLLTTEDFQRIVAKAGL